MDGVHRQGQRTDGMNLGNLDGDQAVAGLYLYHINSELLQTA